MKILFLVPYPVGEAPSQRFRFEQYFDLLTKNNVHFKVSSFWSLAAWKILYKSGHIIPKVLWLLYGFAVRWIDAVRCISYDLIFIHRECTPIGPPLCEFIITKILQKKIIYDFDDAIWLPNTSEENRFAGWIKFHQKVRWICRWSYKVSCGNEWLASFARSYNGSVNVNPTIIDTQQLHNPKNYHIEKADKLVIGWTGTHSTIFYLDSIVPVLKTLEKKYPIKIHIISNKNPSLSLETVEFIKWNKEKEIEQLLQFDIGIMPLVDDDWARGKCGFKAIQYMALEIPCVASPVGVNHSIIENEKNGFLCNSNEDWLNTLEMLIQNEPVRKRVGEAGKHKVIENYSVLSNSAGFLSLTRL